MKKIFLLGCLYTSQTMSGHFASNVMPVIMRREGISLEIIGLVGLISLPMALKFLWAPLVDRYGRRRNHYRTWAIAMQILFAASTLAASRLSISHNLGAIAALMTLSYTFAATQDIAVDAYAMKILTYEERGWGNAIQAAGNMLGGVLGSGAALILYVLTSWETTLITLSVAVLLLGLPLLRARETVVPSRDRATFQDLFSFFGTPGVARWTPVMFLAFGGIFSAMTMCKPLLVDKGYDWYHISLLLGLVPLSGIPAALFAGRAIRKWGRKQTFIICCLCGVAGCGAFIPVAMEKGGTFFLYGSLIGIHVIFAMLMTTIYTIAMDFARQGREGTDFTVFTCLAFIGGMICMALSGLVAQRYGYTVLFACSAALCLAVCGLSLRLYRGGREITPYQKGMEDTRGYLATAHN